jgi:hypothetical protein
MKRIILLIAILALAGCGSSGGPELARYDEVCSSTYFAHTPVWRECRLAMYKAELSRSTVTQSTTVIQGGEKANPGDSAGGGS